MEYFNPKIIEEQSIVNAKLLEVYCVYQHIRLDKNEVYYIGIGKINRPFETDRSLRNSWWYKIYKKIGKKRHIVEVLSTNLNWYSAEIEEIRLIKLYGRYDLGVGSLVNLTNGGGGTPGRIYKEETRRKHSEKQKNAEKTPCTFCKKSFSKQVLGLHHNERCKLNPDYVESVKEKIICPFCKVIGTSKGSMGRHHFDNCSLNPNNFTIKDKPKLTCPYCGFVGTFGSLMTSEHYGNCKQNPNKKEKILVTCPHCLIEGLEGKTMTLLHFHNCKQNPKNIEIIVECPWCKTTGIKSHSMTIKHFDWCKENPNVKKKPTLICPHCKKEGDKGNQIKHHFDNCKLKPSIT